MGVRAKGWLGMVAMGALALSSVTFAAAPARPVVLVPGQTPETRTVEKVATSAPAKEGGDELTNSELNLGTFLFTIAVFICLLIVLRATAWKPILTGLKTREAAIRDSVEAAKRAREEAERSTRELEARMAEAQRQASLQMTQAKADAVKVAEGIRVQAEAEATQLKDRTLREIDAAKQQALTDINNHAAELGTAVARRILQRDVSANDQQRLVEESLAELARKN